MINKLDLAPLRRTGRAKDSITAQYAAPGGGVEDLAFDGVHFHASDEKTFRLYRARVAPEGAQGVTR